MAARRLWAALFLLAARFAAASEPSAKLIDETWEEARLDGVRIGAVHTTVRAAGLDGKNVRTTVDLDLSFRRQNAAIRLHMETGAEETSEGRVVAVFMRQYQDGGRQLILDGKLEEGRMHVQIDGGRIDRRLGWGDDVVGFAGRQRLFRDRKPKPGDQFTYPTYEPTFNAVVLVRATVKEPESIQVAGVARKLLPIRLTPDKLDSRGVKFQPPGETVWLDDDFNIARREIELDGLGSVLLTPTTRQAALAPAPATPAADLGLRSLIPLDRSGEGARLRLPSGSPSHPRRTTRNQSPPDTSKT
jgi:hypothetical protein